MPRRFLRVGLTGGIATGKSYCLRAFEALGAPVIDADLLARDAVGPGSAGLAAVTKRFGPHLVRQDGTLDRAALARTVFADPAARRDLEAIIHPFVFQGIAEWFARLEGDPDAEAAAFGIADVPLLYESGSADKFDRVVLAACPADQQVARMIERDGLSEADARLRLAAQWPIDRKRALSDLVIDTSGTFAETDAQVLALHERLKAEAAGRQPTSDLPR